MSQTQACPDRECLANYALGRLNEVDAEAIALHVRQCSACLAQLNNLDEKPDSFIDGFRNRRTLDPPQTQPALGQLRDYRLIRELGHGGMGMVYEAVHVPLDRRVAIKVLPPERMQNRDAVNRFQREMKAIGKLDHPNIVRAQDAGEADGKHFLVMEFVDGLDVSTLARRIGPLPLADACEIVRQAAVGLAHIHKSGLVHRDVKPSNLIVMPTGVVKVLDLGLALLCEAFGHELTASGQIMGTLDYMAPEQLSNSHEVDARADIYALGATLYRLVTGRAPYADPKYDTTTRKILAITTRPVPPVTEQRSDVSKGLVAILDRLLAKNPDDRYSTAAEVADALAPFARRSDLASMVSQAGKTTWPRSDTNPSTLDHLSSALVDTQSAQAAASPSRQPQTGIGQRRHLLLAVTALVILAACGIVAGIIAHVDSSDGTLVVTVDTPGAMITIDEKRATNLRSSDDGQTYTIAVDSGKHRLEVALQDGTRFFTKDFQIEKGGIQRIHAALESSSSVEEKVATKPDIGNAKPELEELRRQVAVAKSNSISDVPVLRGRLTEYYRRTIGTPEQLVVAELISRLPSPADKLQRESIPAEELAAAGRQTDGNILQELVAVFGSSQLKHWNRVRAISFSPNSRLLAAPGNDGVISIWNSETAMPLVRLHSESNSYEAVTFAKDGAELIALGTGPNAWVVTIWNTETWKVEKRITTELKGPIAKWDSVWIAFSDDASVLVAGREYTVLVHDVRTGRFKSMFRGPSSDVKCVACSKGGEIVAAGDAKGTIFVWETETGVQRKTIDVGHGAVWSIALSPDGNTLAAGYQDRTIAIAQLNADDNVRLISAPTVVGGLAFSRDGQRLLLGSTVGGNGVFEIKVEDGQLIRTLDNSIHCIFPRYSPDGATIACGYGDGRIGLWDASTSASRAKPADHVAGAGIRSIAAAAQGDVLATGGGGGVVIWNVETARPIRVLRATGTPKFVAFAREPNRLFVDYGADGPKVRTARFWDIANGKNQVIAKSTERPYWIPGAVLSADDSFLVSADDQHAITVGESNGRERFIARKHTDRITALAISPNDNLIASAGQDRRIQLWDAQSGDERREILMRSAHGNSLSFSPDGRLLACGASDAKIRLFDVVTGEEVTVLSGHELTSFGVTALAFNLSGALLASSGGDGTVLIWDTKSRKRLRSIAIGPPRGLISAVKFLPDGRHLATANENGTVYLLRLESI